MEEEVKWKWLGPHMATQKTPRGLKVAFIHPRPDGGFDLSIAEHFTEDYGPFKTEEEVKAILETL